MKLLRLAGAIGLFSLALTDISRAEEKKVTWTGWFSDADCASGRAASGTFTATNPDCAKRCIQKGVAPVFISDQAKATFKVKGYSVLEDLGYYLEVQGTVDETAGTIAIGAVKRLASQGAACARPKTSSSK